MRARPATSATRSPRPGRKWPNASSAGASNTAMGKTKHRGIAAVAADFMLNLIAYNLVRIPKLIAA